MRQFQNVLICPISASGSNFNPQNTQCIPPVKIFARLDIEQNIDGGARYLRKMLDNFGGDLKVALAAYNAGPARINSLRRRAKKIGLDPNKWFFNVEHVARKFIGLAPPIKLGQIFP